MIKKSYAILLGSFLYIQSSLNAQVNNCFLYDYEPKTAVIPASVDAEKPTDSASVVVRLKTDTICKVSKYLFGNAIAAWAGAHDNPALIQGTKLLAPSLIRFPGGSWSNAWFLDKVPTDVPDSVYDGTSYNGVSAKKVKWGGFSGKSGGWVTTTDQYYAFRKNTDVAQGLITINYAYARYGTSKNPVAQAAHIAADWVRYDKGRTKFWEIGNENNGPWENGWMIDTSLNQDGQPVFVSGELYGKHFKVFVDSMRKAATEVGATIYIGGIVMAGSGGANGMWGTITANWNEGFFKEAGDSADFYVVHNYFTNSGSVPYILQGARSAIKDNADYVKNDIKKYKAYTKPFALTEYNMNSGTALKSYVNGMQAVVLINEMLKNNFGLGARWLLVTGEDNMFYDGSDANYQKHPHAEFYYLAYLQKYFGDVAISTGSSNSDILCYASRYSSGETGLVIVNQSSKDRVVSVSTDSVGVGGKYYIYSFTGGTDKDFSSLVYINGNGPSSDYQWGPYDELFDIEANAYNTDKEIKFTSPAKSVQMITIEGGTNHIVLKDPVGVKSLSSGTFKLNQNSPNPFNHSTLISYHLSVNSFVTLKVFDFQGKLVSTLVNSHQNEGDYSVRFDASNLQSGVYFYKIDAGQYHDFKKLTVIR